MSGEVVTARPAPVMQAVLAQARMELRLMVRNGESLLVTLGIPLGILVFFSTVDILPTGAGDPVDFLVPGVLAISVMSTGLVAVAIQTGFERKYAVLKRLGATPLSRSQFLVAKSVAVAVVIAVQTVLTLLIAVFALGWEPSGGSSAGVALGMALGAFTFTAIGLAMAGAMRAELTLALSNAVYLALLLVSGLAFDLDALPEVAQTAARALPSGALGDVLRDSLGATSIDTVSLAVLAVWGVLATLVAARTFRWEP